LLAIIGSVGGGMDVGTPELAILMVIWVVGLSWVWVVPLVRHMMHPKVCEGHLSRARAGTDSSMCGRRVMGRPKLMRLLVGEELLELRFVPNRI
jgi:hypothetical protein